MREGAPSVTAQRVAAHRLSFERLEAPYGDPSADERLARDVAGSAVAEPDEPMARYLKGRTTFIDRVVVNALERDVAQVVSIGAGYDGRAWRYAKPGVRWFEVDHPDTQRDKQARLERLGIGSDQVTFVAFDLRRAGLGEALVDCGYMPDVTGLFLCEGVAVYLEPEHLRATLAELRSLATVGVRMALTAMVRSDSEQHGRFAAAVADLGEPVANDLDAQAVAGLLAETGWRAVDISERATRAGFTVAAPDFFPVSAGDAGPAGPRPATRSRVGEFVESVFHRRGLDTLGRHLASTYGSPVTDLQALDVGVFRVERRDAPPWVARVFPAARPVETTEGEALLLRRLAEAGFPAERLAAEQPVSVHEGQAVLVTEFFTGKAAGEDPEGCRMLGELLGRLQSLPTDGPSPIPVGGAWHHLAFAGGPSDELEAAGSLLQDARPRILAHRQGLFDELGEILASCEDCNGFPTALVHADFAPVNVLTGPGRVAVVDWAGAGRGPRLWSLAWLLWATGAGGAECTRAVADGYSSHVALETRELDRLGAAMRTRAVVLACWGLATGRQRLEQTLDWVRSLGPLADGVAATARDFFERPRPTSP